MILQALTELYDDLLKRGEISRPGWVKTKVGFALCLDTDGRILQLLPLTNEETRGTKTITVKRSMVLPAPVVRTSGKVSNFLCDSPGYILGIEKTTDNEKGDKAETEKSDKIQAKKKFQACSDLHKKLLSGVDSEVAKGILNFFSNWDPDKEDECFALQQYKEDLLRGANIVFRVNGTYAHEDPLIADAWQKHYSQTNGETVQCLVTGKMDTLEMIHPFIKGVAGANPSGATLVSFNAEAFSSFGKGQGANAPIGKKAAFAYTTALNHLLADRGNVNFIGDTTIVCWAKGASPKYKEFSKAAIFGGTLPSGISEDELFATVKRLADGRPCQEYDLSPETEFYILGLSPNTARLSVRFFYRNSFGKLMKAVNEHHERMKIVGSRYEYIPLWAMLKSTVNPKSNNSSPNPILTGAVTRAILTGAPYPTSLLEAVMMRIHAERNITPERAAIIKAYYTKNNNNNFPKEILTMSLNENSTNIPYTIGRLFAVYEEAQQRANPGINATIKDKYFNSVAATPAHILPILNNLYQKHLRKLDVSSRVYFEKRVSALMSIFGENLPLKLSPPEQNAFQLGYYHQNQKRFEKKDSKEQ